MLAPDGVAAGGVYCVLVPDPWEGVVTVAEAVGLESAACPQAERPTAAHSPKTGIQRLTMLTLRMERHIVTPDAEIQRALMR